MRIIHKAIKPHRVVASTTFIISRGGKQSYGMSWDDHRSSLVLFDHTGMVLERENEISDPISKACKTPCIQSKMARIVYVIGKLFHIHGGNHSPRTFYLPMEE